MICPSSLPVLRQDRNLTFVEIQCNHRSPQQCCLFDAESLAEVSLEGQSHTERFCNRNEAHLLFNIMENPLLQVVLIDRAGICMSVCEARLEVLYCWRMLYVVVIASNSSFSTAIDAQNFDNWYRFETSNNSIPDGF